MVQSGMQNIAANTECEEIYNNIINEVSKIEKGEAFQIKSEDQENPFVDESPSNDSVDTFVPVGTLAAQIEQSAAAVFSNSSTFDTKKFRSFLEAVKKHSAGLSTKFSINTEEFLYFLRSYFEKIKNNDDPVESFTLMLERKGDKKIIELLALKFFRVIFLQQIAENITFFELSIIYNFSKMYLNEDKFLQKIKKILLKLFIVQIMTTYQTLSTYILSKQFFSEFTTIFEATINALNGTISEIGVKESDVSKIVFIMICFTLEKSRSDFLRSYSSKELFYCAVRAINQGYTFAKRLECFIITKLRWRLACDEEDYTIDKIYQTVFKYEFKKIIGSVRSNSLYFPKYSCKTLHRLSSNEIHEDKNRILVTKVLQTTPNAKKMKDSYSFSPLSKRIGEATKDKESLDSKRKLRFE